MNDMLNCGIIKTVVISEDYFSQLTDNEVHTLNGLMEVSSIFRWLIKTNTTKHIAFIYSQYPIRKSDEETVTVRT
jgi:hypothetical protein